MSAMELFRARVAQSAKAAAGAARQLSSLDEMAENDEYVNSDGLRLSDRKECTPSAVSFAETSDFPSVVEDLSGKFVDALSTATRMPNRPRHVNESHHLGSQLPPVKLADEPKRASREQNQRSKTTTQKPLMSSVSALYDQNDKKKNSICEEKGVKSSTKIKNDIPGSLTTIPSSLGKNTNVLLVNERHAHILHELHYESDTDSSDDENTSKPRNCKPDTDLEMGRLTNTAQLEQELEESIARQKSLNTPTDTSQQKDVHRFMKMTVDLENERQFLLKSPELVTGSTPTNANRVESEDNGLWTSDTRRGTAGEETNKALRAGISWVRNVASPQLEALSKQIMTKVSESDTSKKSSSDRPWRGPMIGPRRLPPTTNDSEEEKIKVTTSAAFLADGDMAELERIRMKHSPSKMMFFVQTCVGNPRIAFIAVTLLFALFVYFYSRHRSVDDVL